MVMLQNLPGSGHVHPLLGLDIPRQLQHGVQIIPQHRPLGRTEGLLFQPLHVLQELLLRFLFQMEILNALGVGIKFVLVVLFPKLLTDGLHLLAQEVVLLVLIDGGAGLLLNIPFQPEHFHLPAQKLDGSFQTADAVQLAEHFRLVREVNAGILGDGVGNEAAALAGQHPQLNGLGRMLAQLQIHAIQGIGLPAQRAGANGVRRLLHTRRFHNAGKVRLALRQLCDLAPADAGDQNPQILSLRFQHLLDLGDTADGIQVFQRRVVHQQILLRDQQQRLVALHGRFQRLYGLAAANFKMNGLFGENAQSPQSKDGHFPCKNGFSQSSSLLFEKRG